jgi:hypothetical protein
MMDTEQVLRGLVKDELLITPKIDNPKWDEAGRVHDWRNYIPDVVKVIWDHLSVETRLMAAYMAEVQANREEWE